MIELQLPGVDQQAGQLSMAMPAVMPQIKPFGVSNMPSIGTVRAVRAGRKIRQISVVCFRRMLMVSDMVHHQSARLVHTIAGHCRPSHLGWQQHKHENGKPAAHMQKSSSYRAADASVTTEADSPTGLMVCTPGAADRG